MSLSFCILGSGSAGNSTLLALNGQSKPRFTLLDCGLSPRQTALRLKRFNVHPSDISDIILTHLDRDHFYPSWVNAAEKHNIRIHLHRRQRRRAASDGLNFRHAELFDDGIALDETTLITSIPFAHDQLGTVGFVIDHQGARLGYATDLGAVPPSLFDHFTGLSALAFESNYDREMQLASARPAFLKRRIMGGRGHLSNEQALEAVRRLAAMNDLQHIALLHLSRQCNCSELVRELYRELAPELAERLTIARQDAPTPVLHVRASAQNGAAPPRRSAIVQGSLFQ